MNRRIVVQSLSLFLASAFTVQAQQFGGPLAVSGSQVFAGEARQSIFPGVVYVFEDASGTWHEVAQLRAGEELGPPDGFGRAIAVQDRWMVIGAPLADDGAGTVYVFRADADGNWTLDGSFAADTPSEDARFGSAIVLHGAVTLVSAPGDQAGAVHVYRRSAVGWDAEGILRPSDESVRGFGSTLATDGDIIIASAPEVRGDSATPATVEAFQYDRASSAWTSLGTLDADELGERSAYGSALALRSGIAYVGASRVMSGVGAVYVFRYDMDASEWSLQTRLTPFDSRPNTLFGTSIVLDGTTTLIGAPGDNEGLGAFYVFGRDNAGNWSSAQKVGSTSLEGRAAFATTAAMGERLAIVGAASVDRRAGAAVIFERNASGGWEERNMVVNERRGFPAVTGGEVVCENDRAASFECADVNIVSFLPIKDIGGGRGTSVNDIWGWVDPETGREYAIVGRTEGTSFVDITDPYNPIYLGDLPMTEGSRPSIWRDMKVYRDHVFIVADNAGEHGVQVFDLTQLRTVRNAPVAFGETYLYDGINSAHNIVINEETGYAYAVGTSGGGETCGGGLHMINIQDPSQPTFAGCFADPTTGRRLTGYVHDAQCVVYHGPDTEHEGKEICMGSNETALSIADVTDKANPVALSMMTYPSVAYTHQGWFSEDQRYFYQNDEGDEPQGLVDGTRTLVWDVVDLDDPVLVKEYIAETTTTDHNLYIRGDLMYQSNYGSGLRVLDISDRENPVEIGFFDTTPYGGGGSWSNYPYFPSGVIIATSMSDGLFILKATRQPRLTP